MKFASSQKKLSKITDIIGIITLLTFLSKSYCLRFRTNEDNNIFRINENYLKKSKIKNLDIFKDLFFREIEKRNILQKTSNSHSYSNSHSQSNTHHNLKKDMVNSTRLNKTMYQTPEDYLNKSPINTEIELWPENQDNRVESEYICTQRNLKFYISQHNQCNVIVNDQVYYDQLKSNTKLLEHMILHNNADSIEPISVTSNDIDIVSFAFNKRLNLFTAFFENPKNITKPIVDFKYLAENLIKTNKGSITNGKESNDTNSFLWKVVNQNLIKVTEKINLEVFFNAGDDFSKFNNTNDADAVSSNLNFTKIFPDLNNNKLVNSLENNKTINKNELDEDDFNNHYNVKYVWNGTLKLHDVIVIDVYFPKIFDTCGNISINLFIVGTGAVFIILLIGMLFFVFSSLFFEEV